MKTEYALKANCVCPINDAITDYYDVIVRTDRLIMVEDIIEILSSATQEPIFQENLTVTVAKALNAEVTTIGYHSGVKTTCTV